MTRSRQGLDHRQAGARIGATLDRTFGWRSHRYRAGLVATDMELLSLDIDDENVRRLAYAELGGTYRFTHRRSWFGARWGAHGSTGTTIAADWKRAIVDAGVFAGGEGGGITLDASWGRVYDANDFEQFAIGGVRTPFFDASVMPQIVAVPGLPSAFMTGSRMATWRLSLGGDLFEPFLLGVAAGDRLPGLRDVYDDYYKVVGLETNVRVPSIPLVRTPGAQVQAGVSYMLDEPLTKRVRVYGGISYRP